MRTIQKRTAPLSLFILLVGMCCATGVQAGGTRSIDQQIMKPTDTLRQSYGHWSFIRPSAASPVCITSNIYSASLPRLVFGNERAPRHGTDEAALTLSVGKWETTQTYSSFLKLFMAQDLQKNAPPANQRYHFKFGENAVVRFRDGTGIQFENYDQLYNIAAADRLNLLIENLQTYAEAELFGTVVKDNNTLLGHEEPFRVTINLEGFAKAYQHMITDCQ